MTRQESDKEDLIQEATALVERAEIECEGWSKIITVGFFQDGRCAVYFDQDLFYQFDDRGLLRRAFEAGFLYRSQGSGLAQLDRRRTTGVNTDSVPVILDRLDLSVSQLQDFRERMTVRVLRLRDAIAKEQYCVRRAVTPDGDIPAGTLPLFNAVLRHGTEFVAPPAGPR